MRKIYIDLDRCLACRACEIACALEHSSTRDLYLAVFQAELPHNRIFVQNSGGRPFPLVCRQCLEPDCLVACKSGAISLDPIAGVVVFDREKCVGCWMCLMNCPFGAMALCSGDKSWADKCDLCPGREIPACEEACPCKAITILLSEEEKI
jgi:carbon-monoxide dehydrogenase iron sulfur subunit